MRLSTFFLLLLGAAAMAVVGWVCWRATADQRAWREFLSYAGKDLHKLEQPQKDRLKQLLSQRDHERVESGHSLMELWAILPFESQKCVVVLETATEINIPGEFDVRAHVFSSEGRILSSTEFSGGWRMMWTSVRPLPEILPGESLIEVGSYFGFGGENVARQYYSVVENKVVLVRLEDDQRQAVSNDYWAPNLRIGPPAPRRSPEEWEQALSSNQAGEILRTLQWLGGKHFDRKNIIREPFHESVEETLRVQEVRARPRVWERIRELEASRNSWIAEAAHLAAVVLLK